VSSAYGAQSVDLAQPSLFEGYDESIMAAEGFINDCGSINFPWIIAMTAMIGNAATVGMFHNPHYYDSEVGMDATGVGGGRNYTGAGGRQQIGGSTIWW
jgi:hypothetical protein